MKVSVQAFDFVQTNFDKLRTKGIAIKFHPLFLTDFIAFRLATGTQNESKSALKIQFKEAMNSKMSLLIFKEIVQKEAQS